MKTEQRLVPSLTVVDSDTRICPMIDSFFSQDSPDVARQEGGGGARPAGDSLRRAAEGRRFPGSCGPNARRRHADPGRTGPHPGRGRGADTARRPRHRQRLDPRSARPDPGTGPEHVGHQPQPRPRCVPLHLTHAHRKSNTNFFPEQSRLFPALSH